MNIDQHVISLFQNNSWSLNIHKNIGSDHQGPITVILTSNNDNLAVTKRDMRCANRFNPWMLISISLICWYFWIHGEKTCLYRGSVWKHSDPRNQRVIFSGSIFSAQTTRCYLFSRENALNLLTQPFEWIFNHVVSR